MTLTLAMGATIIVAAVLAAGLYRQWQRGQNLQRQLQAAARDLEHLQNACARLAPAGVVQSLIADGIQADAGPTAERKSATALFVDLVGFTAMSDRLEPEILLRIINGYYQCVSEAVDEHRGHVGSFVGDGIVAYFGAIRPNPWQCDDAVHAALAMRASIRAYNAELVREGLPPIAIGIGIDHGPGLAGLLGSHARREYAFIGRPVNLAARLQALTRTYGVDILVSAVLRAELDPGFILTPMPAAAVKGFAEPVLTYAVEGRSAHTETGAAPIAPARSNRDLSA
jgi:class 3 adenylate cyclase